MSGDEFLVLEVGGEGDFRIELTNSRSDHVLMLKSPYQHIDPLKYKHMHQMPTSCRQSESPV